LQGVTKCFWQSSEAERAAKKPIASGSEYEAKGKKPERSHKKPELTGYQTRKFR
jgi:hypothetical protein